MPLYALVHDDGHIIKRRQFPNGAPTLSDAKPFRWIADNPPPIKPWQTRTVTTPIPTDATEVPYTVQDRDLATVQADTLRNIRAQAETRLRPLLDQYTEPERLSWERQLAQARDYEADGNATTPLLDALANARGLTRQQIADKVIAAAQQFEAASGAIIGAQQAAEDAAKAATTAEAAYKARNVDWPDV